MRRWFSTTLPIVLTVVTGFWLSGCSDSKDDVLVKSERTHFQAIAANSISLGVW